MSPLADRQVEEDGGPAHFVWAGAFGTRCGGSRLGLPLVVLGDAVEDRAGGGQHTGGGVLDGFDVAV